MKVRLRGKSDETTDSGCVEINQKYGFLCLIFLENKLAYSRKFVNQSLIYFSILYRFN